MVVRGASRGATSPGVESDGPRRLRRSPLAHADFAGMCRPRRSPPACADFAGMCRPLRPLSKSGLDPFAGIRWPARHARNPVQRRLGEPPALAGFEVTGSPTPAAAHAAVGAPQPPTTGCGGPRRLRRDLPNGRRILPARWFNGTASRWHRGCIVPT